MELHTWILLLSVIVCDAVCAFPLGSNMSEKSSYSGEEGEYYYDPADYSGYDNNANNLPSSADAYNDREDCGDASGTHRESVTAGDKGLKRHGLTPPGARDREYGMIGIIRPPPLPPHAWSRGKKSCNVSAVAAWNQTSIFNISREAVEFLTGRVVTRLMPSFYILLFLVSFPLNAAAFLTFSCRIAGKKPAVIYMSQLACVDLLFTLLLPLKIHYQLRASDWRLGEAACRVLSAAYYCYTYCSVLLVTCMSVDRLVAVALPVASLSWRSARRTCCVCALVWLLASAGTAPLLFITQTYRISGVGLTCHDVLYHVELYTNLFFTLSCLFYFLPLVVTFISYSVIIYVLSIKSSPVSSSSSSRGTKRRAVVMAVCVLTEFVVCFAPSHVLLLRHCVRLAVGGDAEYGKYYVMAACAGSASVVLDPLLYYYGSSQCRQQIRSLCCWRRAEKSKSQSNSKSTNISSRQQTSAARLPQQ